MNVLQRHLFRLVIERMEAQHLRRSGSSFHERGADPAVEVSRRVTPWSPATYGQRMKISTC